MTSSCGSDAAAAWGGKQGAGNAAAPPGSRTRSLPLRDRSTPVISITRGLNNNLSESVPKPGCLVYDTSDLSPSPFCLKLDNRFAFRLSFENF